MRDNTHLGQLVSYFRRNLAKGYTLDSLRYALINQGHSRTEIDRAITIIREEQAKKAPKLKSKPKIVYEAYSEDDTPVHNYDSSQKKPFWKRWFS